MLARYATPMSRMQRTGEVDGFERAVGLSLPRGESPTPITLMPGFTPFSASYDAASRPVYAGQESALPVGPYCGCQKLFTFASLPTMKSRTDG